MKGFFVDFLRRGSMSCGIGPVVLAILYVILHRNGDLNALSVDQVCVGILSITVLAFVAGGINAIYRIERLPLMPAILIHGSVLYLCYLVTYLLNDWLKWSVLPLMVFTVIFVIGYIIIWGVIYLITKNNTYKINKMLEKNRRADG